MKNFISTTVIISAFLTVFACNHTSGGPTVTKQGIAPILIGTKVTTLPAQVEGLYDSFKTINEEGDDLGLEPRTYTQFTRNGELIIEADLDLEDNATITSVSIFDPTITYKGIGAGTPVTSVLNAGAKLYVGGAYGDCFFGAVFQLDSIGFDFDYSYGNGFSESGTSKLVKLDYFNQMTMVPFSASDFLPGTKISKIWLH